MDHVAIMNPKLGYIDNILSGEKKIESRWLKNKSAPWGKVSEGDAIYFKDSGKPVTAVAEVEEVEQFAGLEGEKKYCILIHLKNPRRIEPFNIDKRGFGSATAWLCVGDINRIRLE